MWNSYEEYCDFFRVRNMEPLTEEIWRREYAPKDESYREPLIITPKNRNRPMSATFNNHISDVVKKVSRPKKPKSDKAPTEPKPKKPLQTPEQKREWKRNYMKKWRKDNPKASYQHVKNWREKNPDKHRDYNRDWKRTRSKKSPETTSTAPTSGTTTTTR